MTHALRTKTVSAVLLLALAMGTAGCADSFFTRPPEGDLTSDNFYSSAQDLKLATAPLYNQVWFDWNDKASFSIGDARAGNMVTTDQGYAQFTGFSITRANDRLNEGWRSLYLAIAQANLVIENVQNNASGSISEEAKMEAIAEARFIRGYAYSYLAQLWGPVPIVTSASALIDQPDRNRNRTEDVFEFAIRDFEYAAEHLPEEQDQAGRVTEWSAKGMLARMHLARAAFRGGGSLEQGDLDLARSYAEDVIMNSGMSLRDNYGDLFLLSEEDQNNRQESLFALQWTYEGTTWGTQNTTQAYFAAESRLTGVGDGWGGGTGVQGWLIQAYHPDDTRQPETFMMAGDYYPELLQGEGGYTYEAGTNAFNATAIKKYVIGRPEDNGGQVGFMRTGIDTYMLRLSEVYLIYARAIMGNASSTSDPEALEYFNAVRQRAGVPLAEGSITFMDLFMEQWKELAYEGQNWFQLVRWHYQDPSAAIAFIENQNRGYNISYAEDGTVVVERPEGYTPVSVSSDDFSLPYPEADILQNDLLLDEPVPYDFGEQEEQ